MQDTDTSPSVCTSTQPGKQARFCCRCRNHGLMKQFKGHRKECQYRDCICDSCILVAERQRIVAKQVALKRRLEAEKKHAATVASVLELPSKSDTTSLFMEDGEPKKKLCNTKLQQLYSIPEELSPSNYSAASSPSSCSSSLHSTSSSPAIEMNTSDYMSAEDVASPSPVIEMNSPDFMSTDDGVRGTTRDDVAITSSSPPGLEIDTSDFMSAENEASGTTTEDVGIGVEQVVFRPIESGDECYAAYPNQIYAPVTIVTTPNTLTIDPTINKDKMETLEPISNLNPALFASSSNPYHNYKSVTDSPTNSSSVCTPNAPSYGLSPSVVSTSSAAGLSKMFPYDNSSSSSGTSSSCSGFAGYNPVVTSISPPPPTTCKTMAVLMRIFPENNPLQLKAILESCGGNSIKCIETILDFQGAKESPSVQVKQEGPTTVAFNSSTAGCPIIIPSGQVYLHHQQQLYQQQQQQKAALSNRCTGVAPVWSALSQQQQQPTKMTISTGIQNPANKCVFPGSGSTPAVPSCPNADFHTPIHLTTHQSLTAAGAAAMGYPESPSPGLYRMNPSVASSFQDTAAAATPGSGGIGIQKSFTANLPAAAHHQFATVHNIPSASQITMQPIAGVHMKTDKSYGYQTSPGTPLSPKHTTQMYCQTIGQIQPGKCLSYTTSLQAAAIAKQTHTPIMLQPLDTATAAAVGQLNLQIPYLRDGQQQVPTTASQHLYDNQMTCEVSGETTSAFYRWYEKQQQPHQSSPSIGSMTTNSNPLVQPTVAAACPLPQFTLPVCQGTIDSVADHAGAHALVALKTSPSRKLNLNVSEDCTPTINNFLIQ